MFCKLGDTSVPLPSSQQHHRHVLPKYKWCRRGAKLFAPRVRPRLSLGFGNFLTVIRIRWTNIVKKLVDDSELWSLQMKNSLLTSRGGIDSRSILATAIEAFGLDEFRELNKNGKIDLVSNPRMKDDLRIAKELNDTLGLKLISHFPDSKIEPNNKIAPKSKSGRKKILAMWREQRLGRWAIPRWFHNRIDGFWSSGVFGGNFKSPNEFEESVEDGRQFLEKLRNMFDEEQHFVSWRERVISDQLAARFHSLGYRLPFWPIFNRETVMRMHAGQFLGSQRLHPLAFKSLNDAANFLDAAALREHQLHHDLILAGAPKIFGIKYDHTEKDASSEYKPSKLPKLEELLSKGALGESHGRPDRPDPKMENLPCNGIDLVRTVCEEALDLLKKPEIASVVGKPHTMRRRRALEPIVESGGGKFFQLAGSHLPHLVDKLRKLGILND